MSERWTRASGWLAHHEPLDEMVVGSADLRTHVLGRVPSAALDRAARFWRIAALDTPTDAAVSCRRSPWARKSVGAFRARLPLTARCMSSSQVISGHLAGLAIFDQVVSNLLPVVQAAHARSFDGGGVNEDIVSAIVRLDEAVALRRVEPFHGTSRHDVVLSKFCQASRPCSVGKSGKLVHRCVNGRDSFELFALPRSGPTGRTGGGAPRQF